MIRGSAGLLAIALLADCSAPSCPSGSSPVAVYTLFFGRAIGGRADLTDTEWRAFAESEVKATIPDGWTAFDAEGGWRDPATGRTITERTKVLVTALPDTQGSTARISRLRSAYANAFKQKRVGMTAAPACADF